VAEIAWEHLTPAARTRAIALLDHGPPRARLASLRPAVGMPAERDRALFLNAATWPDLVRNHDQDWNVYNRPTWHYADSYWSFSKGEIFDLSGPEAVNAVERIIALRTQLADPGAADTTKAVALAWLLHLVGDIHQPLHCSSRVTALEPSPDGDKGGNKYSLNGSSNLHRYWDGILELAARAVAGEDSIAYATRSAGRIVQEHPETQDTAVSDPRAWQRDGLRLAQTVVYRGLNRGEAPPADYQARALRISEQQMALAGYRLAALLNEALR
jgi:hypothetical protein